MFNINDRVALVEEGEPTYIVIISDILPDGRILVDFEDSNGQVWLGPDGVEIGGVARIFDRETQPATSQFTIVIEVTYDPNPDSQEVVEIVSAPSDEIAIDYVREMYLDDEYPVTILNISAHVTTEAEVILKADRDRTVADANLGWGSSRPGSESE